MSDLIDRQAVKEMLKNHRVDFSTKEDYGTARACVNAVPPAQQNLSEEYAKAVRNWLVNYQIKCAELNGRYTPYEVLGWIVSDWRKENGIW